MKTWQSYSDNPNSPEVYALRRDALARARTGRLVADRVGYLTQLAAGKSVLDIGVVDHKSSASQNSQWLHGHLSRCAANCVGVDVLPHEVAKLREQGYNVLCRDVTVEALPETFDLIVAGEVIEHMEAPGKFMRHCASMLAHTGILAVTAPNPWYANVVIRSVFGRTPFVDSADHVAWYDASVLMELAQRNGLELVRFQGIGGASTRSLRAKVFFRSRPMLTKLGMRIEFFAKSILYEFRRADATGG